MSRQKEELVRFAHYAIARGALDEFLTIVRPDVEFRSLIVEADTQTMYRGHAGVRRWFETIADTFGGFGTEVQGVWDVDDRHAITKLRAYGHVGESEVEQMMWQAVGFRDGQVSWWVFCRTKQEALEAVGLRK